MCYSIIAFRTHTIASLYKYMQISLIIIIYTHYHYLSLYSVNSFRANVICYITIPSLNKVLYFVSCMSESPSH